MKRLLLTLLPVLALSFASMAQDTLFVEEFDGGIPDSWTTSGVNGEIWSWSPDATADEIMYNDTTYSASFTTGFNLNSLSADNGVALFSSEAFDTGGTGMLGMGPIPSPHTSYLTSPVLDCSGTSSVAVRFNQAFLNFQASTFIEVSTDNGENWTSFSISRNDRVPTNFWTGPDDVQIVDITEAAAGEPEVQIRMTFDGDYYFWMVDDIYVIADIPKEVGIPDYFYFSAVDYERPEITPVDTMFFETSVQNQGKDTIENLVLRARVLREEGDNTTTIYEDSTVVADFPPNFQDTILLDGIYVPEEGDLPLGDYIVVYDVFSQDREDFTDINNQSLERFIVGENTFSKTPTPRSGFRYTGGDYEIGNIFEIGPAPALGGDTTTLLASTVTTAIGVPAGENVDGSQLTAVLYKVNDFVNEDLSNFPDDIKEGPEAGMTSIGFAQIEIPMGYEDETPISGELLSSTTGQPDIALEPNAQYVLTISYTDDLSIVFQAGDFLIDYGRNLAYLNWFVDRQLWFLNAFGNNYAPFIELGTELVIVDQDEVPLPEASMNIFPNPVQAGENMNVALDLERPQEANLYVAGMDGRVVSTQQFDSIQKETVQVATQNLPAGQYIIRLSTNDGTRTMKFSVVR